MAAEKPVLYPLSLFFMTAADCSWHPLRALADKGSGARGSLGSMSAQSCSGL